MAGLGLPGWIASASRRQCARWIKAASQDFAPEERAPFADATRAWAESTGQLKLFQRFEAGERLINFELSAAARKIARSLIARLRPRH